VKPILRRGLLLAIVAGAGCAQILSFPDYQPGGTGGGASSTTSATSGTTGGGDAGACSPDGDGGVRCDELCDTAHPCDGGCRWSVSFGDMYTQRANAVAFAPEGDAVVAGDTLGVAFLGDGGDAGTYSFVEKRSRSDGSQVWAKSFGDGMANVVPYGVVVDGAGNIFVAGTVTGALADLDGQNVQGTFGGMQDILVFKLDPNGNVLWAKDFGTTGADYATSITLGTSGSVWVTGHAEDGIRFDSTTSLPGGVFVLNLGPNGKVLWSATYGGLDQAQGISMAPDGSLAVVGQRLVNDPDLLLITLDPAHNPASFSFGDDKPQSGARVAHDADGNIFMLATAQGTLGLGLGCPPLTPASTGEDVVVAKLRPGGECLWARRFPALDMTVPNSVFLKGLAADSAGNVVFATIVDGTVDFSGGTGASVTIPPGFYGDAVVKLRGSDGSHVWSHVTESCGVVGGVGLGLDIQAGGILVAGAHDQPMSFGCTPALTTVGAADVDVTLLAP
jgi:hypothetical protein